MNIELEKLLESNGLNDEKNIIINFVEGLFKIAFTMCVKEDNNDKSIPTVWYRDLKYLVFAHRSWHSTPKTLEIPYMRVIGES